MAGAGYKLFNTGDVLTAAQVNTYLMEQTVMVFANAAARTTALSGVVSEGMISYLKDTNAVEVYDGSNWVSSDDPNAIQNTIVDAKGDLISASAADVPARLAVGNNGETLVADSSTSTGLRWQTIVNRNNAINGAMDCWQRGTSFNSFGNSSTYVADRYYAYRAGLASGMTISRQATGDTTNLPNIQYSMRIQRDSGNTSTAGISLLSDWESVNSIPLAGQTVTFSFFARAGANYSASSNAFVTSLTTGTGTDQALRNGYTGQTAAISLTATLTTTWQRFQASGTIASTATQIGLTFAFNPTGTAGANDWVEVTGIQVELGSVATRFQRSGGNIAGELVACQRYYQRWSGATEALIAQLPAESTTALTGWMPLMVPMRTIPTTPEYSNLHIYAFGVGGYAFTGLAITGNGSTTQALQLGITGATGLTQFRTYVLRGNTSSSAYFAVSAEL